MTDSWLLPVAFWYLLSAPLFGWSISREGTIPFVVAFAFWLVYIPVVGIFLYGAYCAIASVA